VGFFDAADSDSVFSLQDVAFNATVVHPMQGPRIAYKRTPLDRRTVPASGGR